MSSSESFTYESNAPIMTSDNYYLKIKAHVETLGTNHSAVVSMINRVSLSYFKGLSLFDALNLLEDSEGERAKAYLNAVINESKKSDLEITKLILTTVDAVQSTEEDATVDVGIDPELEGKMKKKRGFFGKLFGKK